MNYLTLVKYTKELYSMRSMVDNGKVVLVHQPNIALSSFLREVRGNDMATEMNGTEKHSFTLERDKQET